METADETYHHPVPMKNIFKGGKTMEKKDLIFLAVAQATIEKLTGQVAEEEVKRYFMHWYNIYSNIYDELP